MQRVLSIQTARGFGESSEFVTKRSCISFLFAIGFLCLLGGFMLGRFAAQRTIMVRAEKTRLQLANNGLEISEHLQYRVFEFLQDANFLEDSSTIRNLDKSPGIRTSTQITEEIFSRLKFIDQVFKYKSCTVAKVQGSRESDRYVVISLIEKGIQVVVELVKGLNKIHEEQEWNPRRTILFCACADSSKDCFNELPNYVQSKIVAFVTVPDNTVQGSYNLLSAKEGCLLVSGSNIAQAAVQQAADYMSSFTSKSLSLCDERQLISVPRLDLDIPHAVLSFVNYKNSSLTIEDHSFIMDKKILAQVIGLSIWRLSESIILPWNPQNLNETMFQSLVNIESSGFPGSQENRKMIEDLNNLMDKVTQYSEKLNGMETVNSLNVRIANDLLLDLDKTFHCLDELQHQHQSSERIEECYKNVNGILQA